MHVGLQMGDLSDLTASIREKGVLEPLIVRRHNAGYQIISGERRYQAAWHQKRSIQQRPVLWPSRSGLITNPGPRGKKGRLESLSPV